MEKSEISNDLHDALLQKDKNSFWKIWKQKFGTKPPTCSVDGETSAKVVSEKFSEYFAGVCCPNSNAMNARLRENFHSLLLNYKGDALSSVGSITVKLLDHLL